MRSRKFIYSIFLTLSLVSGYAEFIYGANAVSQTKTAVSQTAVKSDFDKAVEVIMKYEGLHKNKGNLVGYGHKILKGEPYKVNQTLSQAEAEKLLRKDLTKLCETYRSFGKDSLLLATLAYNCGIGTVAKSSVYKKLQAGNRNIKDAYLSYCKANGKTLSQLKRRRIEEFETLFIKD
ncbi:MAG: lysozyme [Bacteroides sp.]|nr:lysozyme [Bacteroides sp.]